MNRKVSSPLINAGVRPPNASTARRVAGRFGRNRDFQRAVRWWLLVALVTQITFSRAETPTADKPKSDGENETADPKVAVHTVLPSETDSRIDTYSGAGMEHYAYFNATAKARNQLLVFLPGTGGKGNASAKFNTLAANEGFHVVSLQYPDNFSISHVQGSEDADSFAKARENVIYGKTPYGKLRVNEANSIDNRLTKLLRYLATQFASENWNQYIGVNSIIWEKVVLAGSSQGGGHAAFLAMKNKVARVILFGSPKDFNMHFNQPAKWYSGESATPIHRYFCFVHSADEGHGCTYQQQLENYKALKLSPEFPVVNVDNEKPPYGHSRLFTSTLKVNNPHASVHQNMAYKAVWKYLLNEGVE